eukprot:3090080-Rhodomonas_salina.1
MLVADHGLQELEGHAFDPAGRTPRVFVVAPAEVAALPREREDEVVVGADGVGKLGAWRDSVPHIARRHIAVARHPIAVARHPIA